MNDEKSVEKSVEKMKVREIDTIIVSVGGWALAEVRMGPGTCMYMYSRARSNTHTHNTTLGFLLLLPHETRAHPNDDAPDTTCTGCCMSLCSSMVRVDESACRSVSSKYNMCTGIIVCWTSVHVHVNEPLCKDTNVNPKNQAAARRARSQTRTRNFVLSHDKNSKFLVNF